MRNHTTPRIHELSGPQGKSAVLSPTAGAGALGTFNLSNIPTGKDGNMWYYCTAIVVAVSLSVTQSGGTGVAIAPFQLYKAISSLQVNTPILGTIATHQNTPGAVAGLLDNIVCQGYNRLPTGDSVPAGNGTYTRTVYFVLPFSHEGLRKPHEISPWGGFLEGGTVEVRTAASGVFSESPGSSLGSATVRCWMELIPSPEAVIHTPFHARLHTGLPGSTTRHTIPDMGSPDGLQGIDLGKGVGIAGLYYLTNLTNSGLGGAGTAANIIGADIPWRDQMRIDAVDSFFLSQFRHAGVQTVPPWATAESIFPFAPNATFVNDNFNSGSAVAFPFISSGRDLETSKLQTVSGPKDLNVTYTATPSGGPIFRGYYFPVFSEDYIRTRLVPMIAPTKAAEAELTAKTLNKQVGGIPGIGKLAYVRQKIQ